MPVQHLCPQCGNTVIKEATTAKRPFACWFCDEKFDASRIVSVERELSSNLIRRELRKNLGAFIKKYRVSRQIQLLQRAFNEYENFCRRQELKIYSSKGLHDFIGSVSNWQKFCEQINAGSQSAPALS